MQHLLNINKIFSVLTVTILSLVLFFQFERISENNKLLTAFSDEEISFIINYTTSFGSFGKKEIPFKEELIIQEVRQYDDSIRLKLLGVNSLNMDSISVFDENENLISTQLPFNTDLESNQLLRKRIYNKATDEFY